MPAHENRLAREASPYLLQHAKNPVEWYPWGPEALERARREDKPILLSIGYAACHWCHVMERESFEDAAIAQRMNELFVNVKVDREERPDLDHIYQLTVQLMGRSGGWPLTVFLTPDQKPFYAGTYFPPTDARGMPGLPTVLEAVADAFNARRAEVERQAGELTRAIGEIQLPRRPEGEGGAGPDALRRASRKLVASFDDRNGGFGAQPKFPNTMALDVMLRRGSLEGDAVCLESVRHALEGMRRGGIFDHLRGGFHRYSTDARWLVPHFEKMLYDNALLLRLYADGFRVFGDEAFAETARAIVGWLFAEMRSPEGAFYASQDADSEGEEGKFFVFSLAEVKEALREEALAREVATSHYGVTEAGNFEASGATVLSAARPLERVATVLDISVNEAREALERARAKLLEARERRPRPARDDKVLASWNALMIGALADAGRALDEPGWIDAAEAAYAALDERLVRDGRVGRYFKDGTAASDGRPGFLDDQAYLGNAAVDLYEATGEPRYMSAARAIADRMIEHHYDAELPGFHFAPDDGEALITRTQEIFDQAVPSSAAMAAVLCLRLAESQDERYRGPAERQLEATGAIAVDNPLGMGQTVSALDRLVRGAVEVVVVGARAEPSARAMVRAAFHAYLPNRFIAHVDPFEKTTVDAVPLLAQGKPAVEGSVVAYVCRGRACSLPVTTAFELESLLAAR